MKLLYVLSFASLAVTASAQTCYPTQIVDRSQGITTVASYDNAHHLTSVSVKSSMGSTNYSVTTEATATGSKKIFTLTNADPSAASFALTKTIVTYDKSNRILQMEGASGFGTMVEKYSYNATGQLLKIDQSSIMKDPSGKTFQDHSWSDYIYTNTTSGNPAEIKKFGTVNDKPGLLIEHYKLTYDNNKAVSDEFPFAAGIYRAFSANNIITAEVDYVTAQTKVNQTYSYTFNAQGYPVSKTYKFSGEMTTDSYEYDCK